MARAMGKTMTIDVSESKRRWLSIFQTVVVPFGVSRKSGCITSPEGK